MQLDRMKTQRMVEAVFRVVFPSATQWTTPTNLCKRAKELASIKGIFPIDTISLKGQYHPAHRGHLIPAGDCCLRAIDPGGSALLPASAGAQMNVFRNHFQAVASAALGRGAKQVTGREIGRSLWRMCGMNYMCY